jgi:hypothetical protein
MTFAAWLAVGSAEDVFFGGVNTRVLYAVFLVELVCGVIVMCLSPFWHCVFAM